MKKIKLIDICTPKQWKTMPTSELLEEGYPVYGANGIIGYCREYNHEDPVIAVTCRGATCGSVNITVSKSYVTGNAMCLDNLRSDVEIDYLYYCLKHYNFKNVISGSAQPQITRQGMKKICIYICNHDEQIVIVHKLKSIENIIELRKRELKKLDDLVRGRFVELFGDPVINQKSWKKKRFDEICENLDSRRRPISSENRIEGAYPYYGASGIVDYVEDFIFDEDILLISEDGANLRMRSSPIAFSVSGKVWVNNHAHVVRFKKMRLQKYVEIYFSLIDISDSITGSAQPKLNQAKLNAMMIPIPDSALLEQYGEFLKQIDKSKFRGLSMLTMMKSAYEQQAFIYP